MIAEPHPVVLITGSSGRIGTALTERLKDRYQVVGLDIKGPPQQPEHTGFVRCDLSNDDSVQEALAQVRQDYGGRIASVVHLAAYYDFSGDPSEKYEQITIRGTQRLLRRLKQFGQVGQFVFSSTMLVHEPTRPGVPMSEEWPLNPKWPYPQSKVRTERVILTEHEQIPCLILRMAGAYDDYCHSLPLSHQIQRVAERWWMAHVYPGNTRHGQAMVHMDDLVESLTNAVDRREELEDELVLLIGEPETAAYEDLQRRIAELVHGEEVARKWQTLRVPKAAAKLGAIVQENVPGVPNDPFIKPWMIDMADDHYELDIGRAQRMLGWKPQHRVMETLPNMIAAMREDPVRWYKEHKLDLPEELLREAERKRALAEQEHEAAKRREQEEREKAKR